MRNITLTIMSMTSSSDDTSLENKNDRYRDVGHSFQRQKSNVGFTHCSNQANMDYLDVTTDFVTNYDVPSDLLKPEPNPSSVNNSNRLDVSVMEDNDLAAEYDQPGPKYKVGFSKEIPRRASLWDSVRYLKYSDGFILNWECFKHYINSQKGRELSEGTSYSIAMFLSILCLSLVFSQVLHASSKAMITVQEYLVFMYSFGALAIGTLLILGFSGKLTQDEHYKSRAKENFIRGGMTLLGTGATIYRSMLFVVYIISPAECRDSHDLVLAITGSLFTIMQIATLLIYTKIRINFNLGVTVLGRFLIMHIVATNSCVWFATVVTESVEEIHHAEESGILYQSDLYGKFPVYDTSDMVHSSLALQHRLAGVGHLRVNRNTSQNYAAEDSTNSTSACDDYSSFINLLVPYLFPMMIEFCVMASSMCVAIWESCGVGSSSNGISSDPCTETDSSETPPSAEDNSSTKPHQPSSYYNSNIGFVTGWVLIALTAVVVIIVLYFLYDHTEDIVTIETVIYGSHASISAIFLIVVPMAAIKMSPLPFKDDGLRSLRHKLRACNHKEISSTFSGIHKRVDQNLLYITLISLMVYKIMSMIGAWQEQSTVILIDGAVSIGMAVFQTFFINWFAFHKRSITHEQRRTKPGRQALEFLRCGNFALWLVDTFLLKNTGAKRVQYTTFGTIGWAICSNIFQPLTILFYFHSMVSVADIITHSYSEKYIGLKENIDGGDIGGDGDDDIDDDDEEEEEESPNETKFGSNQKHIESIAL